jgi:DNA adenine methylase
MMTDKDTTRGVVRSPVKAVGGKRKLVPLIKELMPKTYGRYWEPFLGGGALFFNLLPSRATLVDTNAALMTMYRGLESNVGLVIKKLREHRCTEKHYYEVRERNFRAGSLYQRAADFIFINKTCFNGLHRVNGEGKFNVPFGKYPVDHEFCDESGLRTVARALKGIDLCTIDFEKVTDCARLGDFVYFDPPYVPLSKTSNFVGFTKDGFGMEDQLRLRNLAVRLKDRGVHVILSNSGAEAVYNLYSDTGFRFKQVQAARAVNSDGEGRGKITEVLIY